MKKVFLTIAIALTLVACGQQDDKKDQSQGTDQQKVIIPPGMPTPPVKNYGSTSLTMEPNTQGQSDVPVLKMEEGKPLDLSQLTGKVKKSMGEQATEMIDSIRYQAEQGNADYQYFYGACYEQGWGVPIDYSKAFEWYQKSAQQDQKFSFNALGNLYRTGQGTRQDLQESFKCFQRGTEAKDPQAMLNLGNCHYFGMGTQKDLQQALKWWKESAEYGNAFAKAQMGDCYLYGMGVEKNIEKAVENFEKAAEMNVAGAQYRLGILYYKGEGVKQDITYSELLMKKARDGGMKEAQDFLDKNFKK